MESFQQIINSGKPVLVDFFATWCGPCKAMSPIIESVAKDMQGNARILKIDVDKNKSIAVKYNIQAVPTLLIFKNGNVVWKHPGGIDKQSLVNSLMSHI